MLAMNLGLVYVLTLVKQQGAAIPGYHAESARALRACCLDPEENDSSHAAPLQNKTFPFPLLTK